MKDVKPFVVIALTLQKPMDDLLWNYLSSLLRVEYLDAPENVCAIFYSKASSS
jgi:hypothetical protein